MTIQDEFRAAAEEYTRRRELERRKAAAKEDAAAGRHDVNAAAFAEAVGAAIEHLNDPAPTAQHDLADLAEAIRNDAQENNS